MNHQSDHGYSTGAVSMRCIACGSSDLWCCDGKGAPLARVPVYQDGADFYRDDESENAHLWSAPFKVTDHDMVGAERARALFLEWSARLPRSFAPVFS